MSLFCDTYVTETISLFIYDLYKEKVLQFILSYQAVHFVT